jgi:hypothetical chaperone protein
MKEHRTYLGIDFGTSNCMACAINADGELEYAKLEGDSHLLPTVLFVPRVDFLAESVDEREFEIRLIRAKEDERNRYSQDLADVLRVLETYDGINRPKYPERPKRPQRDDMKSNSLELEILQTDYENDLRKYEGKIAAHQVALEEYRVRRNVYEEEQKKSVRPMANEEALKKIVMVAMQREASEEAEEKYWNQTFFSAITDGKQFVFGREAINMYAEDPMGGFFMRSPKSFLATDLKAEYKNTFVKIVEKILLYIKTQAEKTLHEEFTGIVLGRPINYHGTRGAEGNDDALEIMRRAAINAGFEDVKFFFEPVAAALSINSQAVNETINLIVDVGGGTTDCSLIKYENSDSGDSEFNVLQSGGTRIGGTDFDQAVAWSLLMPHFGKGSYLSSGLPLPTGILYDAISTRDLPAQIRFRKAEYDIYDLVRQAQDKNLLTRFKVLHRLQAQHKIILEAERIKILLSSNSSAVINLSYIENDLRPQINSEQFEKSIEASVNQVLDEVRKVTKEAFQSPKVVYVTGGMSQSPILIQALSDEFQGVAQIRVLDSLAAVGRGLGSVAIGLTLKLNLEYLNRLGLSK